MEDSKKWYQSMAVWGSVAVIASTGLAFAGYTVANDELTGLIQPTLAWVNEGVRLAGCWFALYGRVVASKRIG